MTGLLPRHSFSRHKLSLTLLAYDLRMLACECSHDEPLAMAIDLAQGIAHCGPGEIRGRLQVIQNMVAGQSGTIDLAQAVLRRLDGLMGPAEGEQQSTKEVITWQTTSPSRA